MRERLRRWWPVVKALVSLAILAAIARRFADDLAQPELWQRPLRPGWLALSGALYLLGIGFSALYWRRLLGRLGSRPSLPATMRAYYLGHLGKYLPGKAWALWLRAEHIHRGGVSRGLAVLTSFYEVLTTMAAGALLAAVLFASLGTEGDPGPTGERLARLVRLEGLEQGVLGRGTAVVFSIALLAATGLPLLPPLFNRVVHWLSLPFRDPASPVPRIRLVYLAEGLALTAVGWLLLGAALAAAVAGVAGINLAWSGETLGRLTAGLAVSYVAGFVILLAPGGLGVREFFLTLFLAPELADLAGMGRGEARGLAALTALVLRLVWTAAEVVLAAGLFWLPVAAGEPS
jgi:hypothetical protein